jgi:hypothetical protein
MVKSEIEACWVHSYWKQAAVRIVFFCIYPYGLCLARVLTFNLFRLLYGHNLSIFQDAVAGRGPGLSLIALIVVAMAVTTLFGLSVTSKSSEVESAPDFWQITYISSFAVDHATAGAMTGLNATKSVRISPLHRCVPSCSLIFFKNDLSRSNFITLDRLWSYDVLC